MLKEIIDNKEAEKAEIGEEGKSDREIPEKSFEPAIETAPAPKATIEAPVADHKQVAAEKPAADFALPSESPETQTLKDIESILAEGLNEPPHRIYQSLPAELKAELKTSGEELAKKIFDQTGENKLTAEDVHDLIHDWLRILPEEVSDYFIDERAREKTQKITDYFQLNLKTENK